MGKRAERKAEERQRRAEEVMVSNELKLTDQQILEFEEAFKLFDKDGDGHVTATELEIVFQTLGQKPSKEELDSMISEVDTSGNGEMEFHEFCKLMCKRMNATEDVEALTEAFRILDTDGSNEISKVELKTILESFSRAGEHLDESDIEHLIKEADVDGDGHISFDEFSKVMMKEG